MYYTSKRVEEQKKKKEKKRKTGVGSQKIGALRKRKESFSPVHFDTGSETVGLTLWSYIAVAATPAAIADCMLRFRYTTTYYLPFYS